MRFDLTLNVKSPAWACEIALPNNAYALCHRTMKRHARGIAPRTMQFRGQDFASSERPVKKMGKHGGCGPMSFYH